MHMTYMFKETFNNVYIRFLDLIVEPEEKNSLSKVTWIKNDFFVFFIHLWLLFVGLMKIIHVSNDYWLKKKPWVFLSP